MPSPTWKVILASDGSPAALAAAAFLGEILAQHPAAEVVVLTVLSPVPALAVEAAAALKGEGSVSVLRETLADRALTSSVTALNLPPERVRTLVGSGVAADEIVRAAKSEGADLIVMGHRGLTGLQQVLLGSVSERVLQMAPCPVLVSRSGHGRP